MKEELYRLVIKYCYKTDKVLAKTAITLYTSNYHIIEHKEFLFTPAQEVKMHEIEAEFIEKVIEEYNLELTNHLPGIQMEDNQSRYCHYYRKII